MKSLIGKGEQEGAELLVDGRGKQVDGDEFRNGYFVHPTVLGNVNPNSDTAKTEIFGPVLSMMHVNTVEDAIELVNNRPYRQSSVPVYLLGRCRQGVPAPGGRG